MRDIDNVYTLADSVNHMVESFVFDHMTKTKASNLGLDGRAGLLYVNNDCIASTRYNDRSLQYYGGFEYVDSADRVELGEYVFYMAESDRVSNCIECFNEVEVGV